MTYRIERGDDGKIRAHFDEHTDYPFFITGETVENVKLRARALVEQSIEPYPKTRSFIEMTAPNDD